MTERHVRSSSERMAIPRPKPSFLHTDSDLTVQEGQHAFLNCKIRNIYNETVSWKNIELRERQGPRLRELDPRGQRRDHAT